MTTTNSAAIHFHFETTSLDSSNDSKIERLVSASSLTLPFLGNLLMFALPHHIDVMSYEARIAWPRAVRTVRGKLTAVWGNGP